MANVAMPSKKPNRKVRPELRAAFEQHQIVQARMRKLKTAFKERQNELIGVAKHWTSRRGFKVTSDIFSLFYRGKLEDVLFALAREKRGEPLRVLDDGAGSGRFSQELGKRLRSQYINVHITATSLHNKRRLTNLKNQGAINSLWLKPTETYFPKKPIDAIFSLVGSPNYTLNELRKNNFLKLARCLSKDGFMFASFGIGLKDARMSINETLKGKPFRKNVPTKIYVGGIKKVLERNGFIVDMHPFPFTMSPNFALLIRRKESTLFE